METIAGYSIEGVCRIIDRSWSRWRMFYALAPGLEQRTHPDARTVISGFDLPNINVVTEAGLDPALDLAGVRARVRELSAPFRKRSVGFTWWVGPCTRPGNLDQVLMEEGFEDKKSLVGMAGDLARLDLTHSDFAETDPDRIPVRISEPDRLRQFARASALAYSSLPKAEELSLAAQSRLDYGPGGPVAHFAVRRGKEIYATATVVMEGGWALLAGVGTIPEARGRGLGTAVTVRALREARERDCGLAVLQASEAGRPIYEKLGFREYCRLRRFVWNPDGPVRG